MKSLTFISVEGSQVDFKRLFNFKECTVCLLTSGNEFVFYKYKGHKGYKIGYKIKSINNLKIEDCTVSDKHGNLYIIGKEIHKEKGTYLADLSGVHEDKINLIINEITDYVNEFEYTNPEDKWSVLIPAKHENCTFRDDKVSPAICKHKDNIFKRCEKHICPIKDRRRS